MIDFGHFSLAVAWLLSSYSVVAGVVAARMSNVKLYQSAENGVKLVSFFTLISLFQLGWAFLSHDYRYAYVWQTSNNDMPALYLVSAIWGGMDGSLLLWAGIMSVFGATAVCRAPAATVSMRMWLVPVVALSTGFFLSVVLFLTNPFTLLPIQSLPSDGNGMNPLLQNPSMLIHPPLLYLGFTGFMIPFSVCLAALLSGELSDSWTRLTRRWTLIAWSFLSAGIILGGNWAYIELGWGGFWAWDPVENASFMPWLTGTAFLHSVMVQQRLGMLKIWNVFLAVLTYLLAIFGTFLTRSGIVQSVHAFAETDVGWVFLVYIALLAIIAFGLVIYRRKELAPEATLESYLSREAIFLFNNILLLGICFATFWGVMFPVFSEAFLGEKSVVGPPFFNMINAPLFTALLFFMGVGPLVAWRKSRFSALKKSFLRSLIFGSLLFVVGVFLDPSRLFAALFFGTSGFVLSTVLIELYRGVRTSGSVITLVRRRTRRVGGLIVHLGVIIMAVSMAASSIYKTEKDISIAENEPFAIGSYSLELLGLRQFNGSNYQAVQASVEVKSAESSKVIETLFPERRFYSRSGETTTEVALRMSWKEDLYLAFAGLETIDGEEKLALKVFINPLQVWVWVGGVVMLLGSLLLIQPFAKKEEIVLASLPVKDQGLDLV